MPALTAVSILACKPHAKRREIPDSKAQGLFLIVQPTGGKSWAVRLRRPDGRTAKLTLGKVNSTDDETSAKPVQGGTLTLRQARRLAAEIDSERASGVDVIAERKADRLRQQTATATAAANTFGAIVREFFIKYRTKKWDTRPRRWRENAAAIGLQYPPGSDPATVEPEVIAGSLADTWAKKPITDIDKYQVEAVVEEARKHGSSGKARNLYSVLSVLFGWLPLKFRVAINPMIGVKRPGPPASRDRVLDQTEIIYFWKACEQIGGVFGALYQTLLLSGCRLREMSGMTRAELGDKGVWEVPASRTKNHLPFMAPLPSSALKVINSVEPPPIESGASGHNSGLVFTTNGKAPVSGFSKAKKNLDAEMAKIAGRPITPWRVHDLRRTCSTIMNESPDDGGLGIAPHIVEAVLNHISGGAKAGVAGTYNKAKYLSEKRVALQRWANHIEGVVAGRKANVTPLRSNKRP
jgi:integrase